MSTYANLAALKAAIVAWSNRDDFSDALLTDFVRLGEEQIGLFLRTRFNRKTVRVFVTGSNVVPLPADYVELHMMQPVGTWDGIDQNTFTFAPAPAMIPVSYDSVTAYGTASHEAPINFATLPDASGWMITPTGDWAIDVSYYATLAPVTDNAPYPELFTAHGGIYLSAAMVEVENYLKLPQNERGPWREKLNAHITQLNTIQRQSQMAGGTLITRSPYR